jgi:GNAT superfamily N-acetyltransferase
MLSIRPAVRSDVPLLKTLIYEFAAYERLSANITEEILSRDGFGPRPKYHMLLAEWDSQAAGYACYLDYYSSFQGPGLFLEDIYVRDAYRGKGAGRALMAHVAAIAQRDNGFGVVFNVLDWNEPAIKFYKRLNVTFWNDWKTLCLEGAALRAIAKEAV